MFKKVLIAEDFDIITSGLKATLETLGIAEIVHISYCDEALLKLKKAKSEKEPFDLLISDLSFVEDHHQQKIKCGDDLINAVRKEFTTCNQSRRTNRWRNFSYFRRSFRNARRAGETQRNCSLEIKIQLSFSR